MKVELIKSDSQEDKFPALYQDNDYKRIVYFTDKTNGLLIDAAGTGMKVGTYQKWHDCTYTNVWTRVPNTYKVVLQNENS